MGIEAGLKARLSNLDGALDEIVVHVETGIDEGPRDETLPRRGFQTIAIDYPLPQACLILHLATEMHGLWRGNLDAETVGNLWPEILPAELIAIEDVKDFAMRILTAECPLDGSPQQARVRGLLQRLP